MSRIDLRKLHSFLNRGMTPAEAARRLGVNKSSVTRAIARGKVSMTGLILRDQARLERIIDDKMNVGEQLIDINRIAKRLLTQSSEIAEGKKKLRKDHPLMADPVGTSIRLMGEIRQQINIKIDIYNTFLNLGIVERIIKEMAEAMEEQDTKFKEEFRKRINEKLIILTAVDVFDGMP